MRILIALATYNERENLPGLLDAVLAAVPGADVLVVDDNSPDGTGDLVEKRRKTEPRLLLLRRAGKEGLGTAVIAAFRFAIERDYDLFVNMDADWSHDPASIPALLAEAEHCDIVLGSRYTPGGTVVGWPLSRRLMSRCVNGYARLLLGLRTRDNSGSFRCYRVVALKRLDLNRIRSRGYSFFEEILYRLKRTGATFREVPITFADRRHGSSKINKREAFAALWLILRIGLTGD